MPRYFLVLLMLAGIAASQPYEHVVVTADSMVDAFTPLGSHIEGRTGMNDTVVAIEAVYSSFPGRDDAEKLRNFIIHAYQNWSTTNVLLGGDDDVVPVRFAWARCWWANITLEMPCDLYYSDLDGDWDADGDNVFGEFTDSVDIYPDVHISRIPVSSVASAVLYIGKYLTYVSDSAAPYLGKVLLAGFDIDNRTFGETTMEFYDSTYLPAAMRPCTKVYDSHTGNHREAVLAALNSGQHLFVHSDHGNWNMYGCGVSNHGWRLTREDMYSLTNGTDLSILLSFGCYTGRFDTLDCIVEYALGAPAGGAVAAVGNSRHGLYGRDAGQNPQRTLTTLQLERFLAGLLGHSGYGSLEDFTVAKASLVPLADTSEPDRWCIYTWNLFGESSMPVWIPTQTGVSENRVRGTVRPESWVSSLVHAVLWYPHPGLAELTDVMGRRVMRLQPGGNDVSGVPPGVYFVRAGDDTGRILGKIVKVREE